MDAFLTFVSNSGAWILALMGVGMSFNPPTKEDRRSQWRWFWAFAAVGLVVGGAQFWREVRNQAAQEAFEAKLTGGGNYCYFEVLLDKPQPNGGYEWQIRNHEQRPIPNMQVCLYREDQFLRCWQQGMCIPHSVNQAKDEGPIKLGTHRFEFFAANHWSQTLEIFMEGEVPKQRGEIYRDGKVIGRIPNESR